MQWMCARAARGNTQENIVNTCQTSSFLRIHKKFMHRTPFSFIYGVAVSRAIAEAAQASWLFKCMTVCTKRSNGVFHVVDKCFDVTCCKLWMLDDVRSLQRNRQKLKQMVEADTTNDQKLSIIISPLSWHFFILSKHRC